MLNRYSLLNRYRHTISTGTVWYSKTQDLNDTTIIQ